MLYIIWNTSYLSQLKISKLAKDNKRLLLSSCVFSEEKVQSFSKPLHLRGFCLDLWNCIFFWKYSGTHHQVHGEIPAANDTSSYMSCKCYNSGSKLLTSYCCNVQSQFRLGVAFFKLWSPQDMLHKSLMLNLGAIGSEGISFIMSDVMFTSRVIISLSIYPSLFPSNCLWPVHPK